MSTQQKAVYAAINKVQAEIAKTGISKDRNNAQQNYKFRGIDDVYNALSPLLADAGLCILPRVISRTQSERATSQGKVMFTTVVEVEFDFVSAEDGSCHVVKTFGEANDTADKSTNKAMSAAYKYAAMQAFAIPTEGDNDADAHTNEPAVFMRTEDIAGWVTYIQSSTTSGDLKARLAEAISAADSIKDKKAAEEFSRAAEEKIAAARAKATQG